MKPSSEIRDVSDTAIWVASYRAEESLRSDALFRDPLAQKLIGDRGRAIAESMGKMGKYTQWSVISRTVILDRFIQDAVAGGVERIINLGAGLDTRPYRMSLPQDLEWIEVDQAQIIDLKNDLLHEEKPACRLKRVTVNLADAKARREFLDEACAPPRRTLVLTEGVIPYLTETQVEDLARELHAQSSIVSWITEYFDPRVYPYLQTRYRVKQMQNAPFLFFPADFLGFFAQVGWMPKIIRYSSEVAKESGRKVPLPWFAFFFRLFASEASREKSRKLSGYMILEKA
jgi:methyltransferase (TIGR00027 family)